MKVLPFIIPKSDQATLVVQEDKGHQFYDKLHQHQEIQISWIKKGEGTFIIGDYIGEFEKGDVFVIGEHLPHVFNNDTSDEGVHMISLFFIKSSFGDHFFNLPEFNQLAPLFKASALGSKLDGSKNNLSDLMEGIISKPQFDRFISFMEILKTIANENIRPLSSIIHTKTYGEEEGKRMRDIFTYTLENFHKNINLNQVAAIAHMTPNAFCRYFKQRTNKTYINFLLEIRIGNACKLLTRNTDLSIAEISYKSGFNNLTNFNRKFKSLKGLTPTEFKKSA